MALFRRKNPSKCNDGSFSASGATKGTCTYHKGVERRASREEYNEAQSVVGYRKPKKHQGQIATSTYKRKTKKKQQATKKPVAEKVVFKVNKNSFNEQYKNLEYSDNNELKEAIIESLYSFDLITKSNIPILRDSYTLTEVKTLVTNELLSQWEEGVDSEAELHDAIDAYFNKIGEELQKIAELKEEADTGDDFDPNNLPLGTDEMFFGFSTSKRLLESLKQPITLDNTLSRALSLPRNTDLKTIVEQAFNDDWTLQYRPNPRSKAKKKPKIYVLTKGNAIANLGSGSMAESMYAKWLYEHQKPHLFVKLKK